MDSVETRISKSTGYIIRGEDKWLLREDGVEIGPTDATECELKLWDALLASAPA